MKRYTQEEIDLIDSMYDFLRYVDAPESMVNDIMVEFDRLGRGLCTLPGSTEIWDECSSLWFDALEAARL